MPRTDIFFDQGCRLWIARTAQKHFWRVASWYDLDDLVQDGYLCWAITRRTYSDLIDAAQINHFMALFKRVYLNHITDLANKRTRQAPEVSLTIIMNEDDEAESQFDPPVPEESTLAVTLAQAPKVVQNFLQAMDTERGRRAMQSRLRQTSTHLETPNERLCRLAGADPEAIDMEWEIRDALAPA